MSRTRVVVADRHPVLLQGLSTVLGAEGDFEIVATCGDAMSCIGAIRTLAPNIAILDPTMPELVTLKNSFGASADSRTRVVLYVAAEDRDLVLADGLDGCSVILKEASAEALVQSLRQIASGVRIVPPSSRVQIAPATQAANSDNALTVLTDRERQIIRLVSEGLSNKEIGRRLNIADGTIKVHLHHMFQKLEISNRTALAALAFSLNDSGTPVKSPESE